MIPGSLGLSAMPSKSHARVSAGGVATESDADTPTDART